MTNDETIAPSIRVIWPGYAAHGGVVAVDRLIGEWRAGLQGLECGGHPHAPGGEGGMVGTGLGWVVLEGEEATGEAAEGGVDD